MNQVSTGSSGRLAPPEAQQPDTGTPEAEPAGSSLHGVASRVLGVLRRPRLTLQEVVSQPRWVSLLVVLTLATAAAGALVSATEVGQLALVDQWERTALAFGQQVDDAAYLNLQAWSRLGPMVAAGNALLAGPVLAFVVSMILFLWLRRTAAAAGGAVSYSQVLAVVVHAGVILAVGRLVAAPLVYARETTASAT